jgi:glycine/serine hydroxymethyltransferase
MEACNITVNKNTVPGDTRPMVPGGVRIGTPAMTTRGLKEAEFEVVSDFLHRSVQITQSLVKQGTSPLHFQLPVWLHSYVTRLCVVRAVRVWSWWC